MSREPCDDRLERVADQEAENHRNEQRRRRLKEEEKRDNREHPQGDEIAGIACAFTHAGNGSKNDAALRVSAT
jgi:hypothetical protein